MDQSRMCSNCLGNLTRKPALASVGFCREDLVDEDDEWLFDETPSPAGCDQMTSLLDNLHSNTDNQLGGVQAALGDLRWAEIAQSASLTPPSLFQDGDTGQTASSTDDWASNTEGSDLGCDPSIMLDMTLPWLDSTLDIDAMEVGHVSEQNDVAPTLETGISLPQLLPVMDSYMPWQTPKLDDFLGNLETNTDVSLLVDPLLQLDNDAALFDTPTDSNLTGLQCWDHGCNGRVFSTRSNLRRHCKEQSRLRPNHFCPRCMAYFSRTSARNRHVFMRSCHRIRRYSNGRERPSLGKR